MLTLKVIEKYSVCTCIPHHGRQLVDYPRNLIPVFKMNSG